MADMQVLMPRHQVLADEIRCIWLWQHGYNDVTWCILLCSWGMQRWCGLRCTRRWRGLSCWDLCLQGHSTSEGPKLPRAPALQLQSAYRYGVPPECHASRLNETLPALRLRQVWLCCMPTRYFQHMHLVTYIEGQD